MRLTNICVFLAAVLMLYAATFLSTKPAPRRPVVRGAQWSSPDADLQAAQAAAEAAAAAAAPARARPVRRAETAAAASAPAAAKEPVVFNVAAPAAKQPPAEVAAEAPPKPSLKSASRLDGTLESGLELAAPRGPGFLMVTFSNSALKDHLFNFVAHCQEAGTPHLIGAVDAETFDLLQERTAVYKTPLASANYKMDGSNQHSSGSWKRFASMRTGEVARIVGLGYSVLHTDCDVIWLRDPSPYLMCTAAAEQGEFSAASRWPCAAMRQADVAVSSDNMSPGRDTEGHASYSAGGTFNTGILFIRGNAQGQGFAKAWHKNVAEPARGTRFYADTSDQQVFNHMMRDPKFWPGISAPHGEHVMKTFYDEGGPFRLGALPMGLFMNGHGYFVGASHARLQVQPLAVHATYSLDRHDGVAKRQRFREAGLWRSDPDEYFQGAYLALNASVSPRVQRAIDAFAAKRQSPNNVGVHATALQEYVAELRDALALARALRRTLVLPRWLCYCDRLWSPSDDIFHFGCMYPGAQDGKFLPFVCPMDHVLSPTDWEQAGQPYRDAAFLESSRLPAAAKASITDVAVLPRAAFDALPPASRQHALPSGVTDKEAVQLLRPLEGTAVLRLSHARGLLCGIDDAAERSAFNSLASRLLRTPAWGAKCFQPCSSELAQWLTPEEISAGGGSRGNFFSLSLKPPPAFKAGTCVRNIEE